MTGKTSFGQWLKQRRKGLDLTQAGLAQRIGCAASTLYKVEADERRPSKQIAGLLAIHLNVPPDEQTAFVRFARGEAAPATARWGTPVHSQTNLPAQPTPLIGREADVAALRKKLLQPESRLLTLLGPPGIGKTRLALQAASQVLDDFADGVFLIALAPISDAGLVPATIADMLGVQETGPQTALQQLKVFLRDRQMLLVLDNFEQIVGAAPQVAELLAACAWLKILVTSRAPLRIRYERQMPVAPLALPDLARLPDADTLTSCPAIMLFMERAQAVRPDFLLTQENAPAVAGICIRLDGLPLAIELISARIKLLSPAALLERLGGQLLLHSDGLRDLEPRHRTLNAAIDWSCQLLSAEEQTLFQRLSVFVGGWTLEPTEAICLENLNLDLLQGLSSLLDKNLIRQDTQPDGERRFTMLETIRQYALERLSASGELETLQRRHAEYFVRWVEAGPPAPASTGRLRRLWWDWQEAEHANLRAALLWCRKEPGAETGLRLAIALGEFWARRGHLSEGSNWLADALDRAEASLSSALPTPAQRLLWARALAWLALFSVWRGNLEAADQKYQTSLALFRELGGQVELADSLGSYGMMLVVSGDYERAGAILGESLDLARELEDTGLIAWCYFFQGTLAYARGDWQRSGVLWRESLDLFRAADDLWGISGPLIDLGLLALDRGDYAQADAYLVESLILLRQLDERWHTAIALALVACLAAERGRAAGAGSGAIWTARLFGATEAMRERLLVPLLSIYQDRYRKGIAAVRAQLDEASLAAAWAEGRTMTLDQAVDQALGGVLAPSAPSL